MEGAFTHLENHTVSNSASAINAGDDESILDGDFSRLPASAARRRRQDDDEETDVFDDDDIESMASLAIITGADGKPVTKAEEQVELPAHACS
jgi:hypothetical protein